MYLLENLEYLMNKYRLNRTELARNIGIAPSTINSWYNRSCENISLKTLLKLSGFFSVSIEDLVHKRTIPDLIFSSVDYTEEELEAIKNFANFIVESRGGDGA